MKKKLGQIFLRNESIARYIASLPSKNSTVLEIGAGDGRITKHIKAKKVYAVEIDKELCKKLSMLNVKVICNDFLKIKPFRVDVIIGNIPYYISSDILFKLTEWDFKEAFLIFQYEFAKKMVAKPGQSNYGRLSVTSQLCFDVNFIKIIKRGSFFPVPKVDSGLVRIRKKGVISKKLADFIRLLFSQKNKKLKNIIKNVPEKFENKRPRHMSVDEVVELFNTIEFGDDEF